MSASITVQVHVSKAELALVLDRDVLGLGAAERPDLVALVHLSCAPQGAIQVWLHATPRVDRTLDGGALRRARHPHCGADAHALDQARDQLPSALGAERVDSDHDT